MRRDERARKILKETKMKIKRWIIRKRNSINKLVSCKGVKRKNNKNSKKK